MAEISKITLPTGNTYDIKDATARAAIASLEGGQYFLGKSTTALTDGATTNPIQIDGVTGTTTAVNGNVVTYGNAEFIFNGTKWIEFGDLSNLGTLASKNTVSLNKGSGANALGTSATFTTTVTPTTTNIKATASGGGAAWNSKDSKTVLTGVKVTTQPTIALATGATAGTGVISVATGITSASASFSSTDSKTCLTGVSASKKKLTTTSVPNVTSAGSASTWSFAMGSGNDAETLIISGANSTAPTLGTAITCATGGLSETSVSTNVGGTVAVDASSNGTATVVGTSATLSASVTPTTTNIKATASGTAVGADGTASVIGASSTFTNTQPTVSLATGATAGTGVISVATGITSASTSVNSNDAKKVALYDDLSVSVS